nr:ribonuclease H-like domain-containing protein [Tanacetum cinerariifolium]
MFRINHFKTFREEKQVPNTVSASSRTKPITVSQPHVITKKNVNSDVNGLSSTGIDNTKTRRPQPRSNTKNDRVLSASKSSQNKNKEAEVEEHHRNLLLFKNNKHISSACNNSKIDSHDNQKPKASKPNNVGTRESLALPKPRKPRFLLRWSPTGKMFNQDGKLVASSKSESQVDCSNGDNACTSNAMEPKIKWFPNSTSLLGRFKNYNLAAIHHYGDLQWGNIVFLNVCIMVAGIRLSHLNFDTINDLARNDLVAGLPKFKYNKEHLCPSCEQGKSKRTSHPPKPVPNSRQRLHLLHMDLCGPMRIASINGKRYILVIVDDYSRYTWVHFLRSKDEAPAVIITFLKKITVLLQSTVVIIRTDNGTEFKNQTMNVSFDELSAMAFEQCSSKPELQSMTSGQISSELDTTYAPSTITNQQPTEGELDLLFEAMYDDYFGGQLLATVETVPPIQEPQVRQTSTASTTIADDVPIPTNSSSRETNIPITSQDVDELNPNA